MKIRRALPQDAEHIIQVHERSIREVCAKDYTPEQIEAWAGRKAKAQLWMNTIERDLVWVVELNNKIVGFGHLAFMEETRAEVMGLYFTPELKGLGAGKKLITIMKDESMLIGVKTLTLYSTLTAKTFYEQCGFLQTESDTTVEMRGVAIPCHPMTCLLS